MSDCCRGSRCRGKSRRAARGRRRLRIPQPRSIDRRESAAISSTGTRGGPGGNPRIARNSYTDVWSCQEPCRRITGRQLSHCVHCAYGLRLTRLVAMTPTLQTIPTHAYFYYYQSFYQISKFVSIHQLKDLSSRLSLLNVKGCSLSLAYLLCTNINHIDFLSLTLIIASAGFYKY